MKIQDDEIYGCDSIIMALWLQSFYISVIFALCSMIHHLNYKKLVITVLGKMCNLKKFSTIICDSL